MLFKILSKLGSIGKTISFYLKYNLNSKEWKKLFYFTRVNGSLYRNKLRRMVKIMEKTIYFTRVNGWFYFLFFYKWLVLCIEKINGINYIKHI